MILSNHVISYLKIIPVLIVSGIICSCENDLKEVELLTQKENRPLRSGKNVELIYSESALVKVKVTAPVMEQYMGEKDYTEMPEGMVVLFYDSLMNVSSKLTSNYAIHRMSDRKMEAKDDVVVVNEKGEQLNTEHLIWDEESAKIYSEEFVKITTEEEILTGKGFESNQTFTKYKIDSITGIFNLKEAEENDTIR